LFFQNKESLKFSIQTGKVKFIIIEMRLKNKLAKPKSRLQNEQNIQL